MPRMHAELVERGSYVGRKRISRRMRGAGLRGVSRRKQVSTTARDELATPAIASASALDYLGAISYPPWAWSSDDAKAVHRPPDRGNSRLADVSMTGYPASGDEIWNSIPASRGRAD